MVSFRACWKVRAFQLRAFRAGSFLGARQSRYTAAAFSPFPKNTRGEGRRYPRRCCSFSVLIRATGGAWGAFRASLKDFE